MLLIQVHPVRKETGSTSPQKTSGGLLVLEEGLHVVRANARAVGEAGRSATDASLCLLDRTFLNVRVTRLRDPFSSQYLGCLPCLIPYALLPQAPQPLNTLGSDCKES